ncbi:MAG: glycosyltransferase [Ideonella sp.]|nr:glycosyltransferase [Ideonella sp.]
MDAVGWANVGADGEVVLIVDDRTVACGPANRFRADVLEAGIGTGHHGFQIALPPELLDGRSHRIRVQAGPDGRTIEPGEREFKLPRAVHGAIERVDGAFVTGWAAEDVAPGKPLPVELRVDGTAVAIGAADQPGAQGMRYALRLPNAALDGRPHVIAVRSTSPPGLIGETALITSPLLTPDDALRRYSGGYVNAALLQGAALHYESLRQGVAAIAASLRAGQEGAQARTAERLLALDTVHEQVVLGFTADEDANDSARDRPPLAFPTQDAPDVSIVIPVHNKFAVTYHCLASLLLAPNRASFEVIVIDDGSSDETIEIEERVSGIRVARHEAAQGFVRACNAGAKLANGRYIAMLNNDTEVTPGWLDELVHVFEHFEGVGMAGAKLLYPNGSLQEAGGIVWGSGDPWNYGRNGNPRDPKYNYTRQVDYISGACIMLPTALWQELGGFDEHFAPAYFEDTDLAFRVRDRGLKTVYAPLAQVIHFEGISSGTSVASGTKRFQQINKPKFKNRWAAAFRGNGAVGKDVDLAKDRNVRFRVLVIDAGTPRPDNDAGSYAAIQEMRLLQSLGCKLTFVPENVAWLSGYTEALQRSGIECLYAPFVLSVSEVIEKRGAEFDFVYITRYSVAERYVDAIRRHAPQAKVLFNNADLHFLREIRSAIAARNKERLGHALQTRDAELGVMRKVDLVLSYNEIEHAVILSHNLDSTRVAKCPWIVATTTEVPPAEARRGIAFLGGYAHHPNVEAAEFFVREVMPLLRQRLPGVELRLYGSNMPEKLRELFEDEEDVATPGWVPTVDAVYDGCRVFVAPLLSGAGIKGKVIGAMAHGVPCVLSPVAAEGTGIRAGLEAQVASTPREWVDAIARLYEDGDAWRAQQAAAWTFTEREFGLARGLELMQAALEVVEIFATPDPDCLAARARPH